MCLANKNGQSYIANPKILTVISIAEKRGCALVVPTSRDRDEALKSAGCWNANAYCLPIIHSLIPFGNYQVATFQAALNFD